jgi:hypothetical protein
MPVLTEKPLLDFYGLIHSNALQPYQHMVLTQYKTILYTIHEIFKNRNYARTYF